MNRRRTGKFISVLAAVFVLLMSSALNVRAADAKIMSAQISEDALYLYVKGAAQDTEVSVQIGTSRIDQDLVSVSPVSELDVPMQTLILLDNSLSIPLEDRAEILTILNACVDEKLDGEMMRIGTYSSEIAWLCDVVRDQEELCAAIDEISFVNQASYLSDVLYDLISELNEGDESTYTRILVITDGADGESIGYTNEEVRTLIGNSPYPVYTIGVQTADNSAELETLFSFSRSSSAEYFLLGETSSEEILEALCGDQDNTRVAVTLDASMQDGTVRTVLLSLDAREGATDLTVSVTMPLLSGKSDSGAESGTGSEDGTASEAAAADEEQDVEDDSAAEPAETAEVIEAEDTEKEDTETEETTAENVDAETEAADPGEGGSGAVPAGMIAAGVVILAAAAAAAVILIVRRKQGSGREGNEGADRESGDSGRAGTQALSSGKAPKGEETLFAGADDDGATIMMGARGAKDAQGEDRYLVLTNLDHPGTRYKVRIQNSVTIGRSGTDLVIRDDPEVSRSHCRLELSGTSLYLEDTGSKNGTIYEGRRLAQGQRTLIAPGGRVKIGQHTYTVDLLQER